MAATNAYFRLSIRQSGTYLILCPATDGGNEISFEELDAYLSRKKLDYDKKTLVDALKNLTAQKELLLTTEKIFKEDETVRIKISTDHKTALGVFFPPTEDGLLLTKEEIVQEMVKAGVKYGLQEDVLAEFLQNREYCREYVLAKETPPIEGRSAVIVYHFNTDLTMKPKTLEDGSVDFHQLDTISSVNKGDLLAELTPAIQGRPGIDVCGNAIRPAKINHAVLKHGNNIHLSEDSLKMYSDVNGHVTLVDGRVFVSDTFEVGADVDNSTGDIKCEGNVHVKGNVRTGFKIEAKGDVIVDGVVEGATIIAGGQIVLKRGIQGMSRGSLLADGNVISKFIENAEVRSKSGYVQAEAILHSRITAKTDVIVSGKKGFISGGEVHCGQMISAKTIGSSMGTNTLLEVGVDPSIVEEYHRLEKELPEVMQEKEKAVQTMNLLAKKLRMGEKLAPDKLLALKMAKLKNEEMEKREQEINERLDALSGEMEMKVSGIVKVSGTIYQGCKIVISEVVYYVKTELQHARFVKDRADVKVESY